MFDPGDLPLVQLAPSQREDDRGRGRLGLPGEELAPGEVDVDPGRAHLPEGADRPRKLAFDGAMKVDVGLQLARAEGSCPVEQLIT
jgi:hypothetical protein